MEDLSGASEEATVVPPVVDYLVIVDFEATCDTSDEHISRLQQCDIHEIIEFPAVLCRRDLNEDTPMGTEIAFFRQHVQPTEAPAGEPKRVLADFCVSLTGITQEVVDASKPLAGVLEDFYAWLEEYGLMSALEEGRAVLVAHGGWDLGDQLPRECARKGLTLPPTFEVYADLKVLFALTCPDHRGTSLKQMLDQCHLQVQGRQHCGIDDCRNFARILGVLLSRGADVTPTHRGGVDQLRGHGAGVRLGDWLCVCGAIAFGSKTVCFRCGAVRPPDAPTRPSSSAPPPPPPPPPPPLHPPPGAPAAARRGGGRGEARPTHRAASGAAAAAAAATAAAAAGDGPSSQAPRRPGDWDCLACRAVVFGSKPRCFKCGAARPNAAEVPSSSHPKQQSQRRPGDWDCPNPQCRALVFASKTACFRCGSPPSPQQMYAAMGLAPYAVAAYAPHGATLAGAAGAPMMAAHSMQQSRTRRPAARCCGGYAAGGSYGYGPTGTSRRGAACRDVGRGGARYGTAAGGGGRRRDGVWRDAAARVRARVSADGGRAELPRLPGVLRGPVYRAAAAAAAAVSEERALPCVGKRAMGHTS